MPNNKDGSVHACSLQTHCYFVLQLTIAAELYEPESSNQYKSSEKISLLQNNKQ